MNKVTVIGGGTGSFVVLTGLKRLPGIKLTAIVPATDSGGSSGRLKDEFGYLPVGDVRQCLVALAEDEEDQMLLRQLFSYRFDKGEDGLKGHNFGNLFLTALTDILGNEVEAIKMVRKLMHIRGSVYPISLHQTNLVAEYENGAKIVGEHFIDEPPYPHDGRLQIAELSVDPIVETHALINSAITNADLIIIGPGDLYTSLLANFVISGVKDILSRTPAKIVYVMNLVTRFGQTYGYTATKHLQEVEKYLGRPVDFILVNNAELPEDILARYRMQNDEPVMNDLTGDPRIVLADLLASERIVTAKGDVLKRSLIRHDSGKLAKVIADVISRLKPAVDGNI